jgi:processive 1,2-diacylglycerol beta-glucosyltransferase
VITDFGVHAYWYHDEVDLYLVGHEDIKQEMVRRGISEDRIRVTGIPISPKFGETSDPASNRQRLRLDPNKKTILLMGGSRGLGSLSEVVQNLKTIPLDFQTIVVCGRNKKVHKQIMQQTSGLKEFKVFGYIKDLSWVMGAADILISKPGGLTTSEALAKQLPMVLTDPIPGQEERNVQFLTRHHVARVARTKEDLIHIVSDLFRHPKKLQAMRHRAKFLSKPFSAWEAARVIFGMANRAKAR